jgi:hypothetical protein
MEILWRKREEENQIRMREAVNSRECQLHFDPESFVFPWAI